MLSREEIVEYCKTSENVYDNYPFGDDVNWVALRIKKTKKCFIFVYERNNCLCINAKCEPMYAEFLRNIYPSVTPAYHMNKKHWNTITIDGSLSNEEIFKQIDHAKSLVENNK